MTHLSDEQLEDVLSGPADEPAHLAECRTCRGRLADRRAIRARLRSAFEGVGAEAALAGRIRRSLAEARRVTILRPRWFVPLAAAAAALIVAIPLAVHMLTPAPAVAHLAEIHRRNLAPHEEFFTEAEPEKLAAYMTEHLGFEPNMPTPGAGLALRGCCIAHFRDKPVGSYVVDTPKGAVSIIVVTEKPEAIGIKGALGRGGRTFGVGSFARCNMATVEMGGYTYCAVGEVSVDVLADLLERVVR